MTPRFRRYLLRSLPLLAALLVLTWLLNLIGTATGAPWLRFSPWLALLVWLVNFGLRWWTRSDPQKRD